MKKTNDVAIRAIQDAEVLMRTAINAVNQAQRDLTHVTHTIDIHYNLGLASRQLHQVCQMLNEVDKNNVDMDSSWQRKHR